MFESEYLMVEKFTESVSPSLWTKAPEQMHVHSVFESDCSDGRADWVWAQSASRLPVSWCDETVALLQNPTCSKILAFLKRSSPRTREFLKLRIGVSNATLDRAIRSLVKARLIEQSDDRLFLLGAKAEFPDVEICAFEFKLEDWKRAFFQATRYRTFAHRVYVVLPASVIHRTEKLWDSFRLQNVGLLSYDSEKGASRILPTRKRKPKSRSNFLQAIGMLHEWS